MRIKKFPEYAVEFLRKKDYLYAQLLFLLSVSMFVGLIFPLHFIQKNTLYWDNFRLFSVFRENLHSLNYFGEIQWWNPRIQSGFPVYYFSILGCNTTTPLFAAMAFVSWLIGQLNIYIYDYLPLYVFYFGFLVPAVFSLSVFSLSMQIFEKNGKVMLFIIVASSISPGVVFNLTDNGLEQTAYGIFFASAFLRFIRAPHRANLLLLTLSLLILGVSFNHLFLYWNILFVPMFAIVSFLFGKETVMEKLRRIKKAVSWKYAIPIVLFFIICISPILITYTHGENIVRSSIGERVYDYEKLIHGNPIEAFSVSTPGIGFEWKNGSFSPQNYEQISSDENYDNHLGYNYMGMIILPLVIIGLLGGADPWRIRLLIMIFVSLTVFILSGYSPLFSVILTLPTPLRAVSHYSDTLFRNGVFFLMILASGAGLDAVLREPSKWGKRAIWAFIGTFLFSFGLFASVYREGVLCTHLTGLILVVGGGYAVILYLFKTASLNGVSKRFFAVFLFIFLIDTSTFAFWHIRDVMWKNEKTVFKPSIKEIGASYLDMPSHAYTILELKQLVELRNNWMDYSIFPQTSLFNNAAQTAPEAYRQISSPVTRSSMVVLPGKYAYSDAFKGFFVAPPDNSTYGYVNIAKQSYNSYRMVSGATRKAILFLRDSYFPGWSATVNGKKAEIAEAFWAFKAVVIPEGKSEVRFVFSPGILPYALFLSYATLLFVFIMWSYSYISERKRKDIAGR